MLRKFLVIALLFSFSVTTASAQGKQSLVSLGDSITFGYNLDENNDRPSHEAFPSLIADHEHLRVRNMGMPGAASADLLAFLATAQGKDTVRHADVITITIGGNDFLQGGKPIIEKLTARRDYQPSLEDLQLLAGISAKLSANLNRIVSEIRKLTDAPIIVYNIYNPIPGMDDLAALLLGEANRNIASLERFPHVKIADAFDAFAGKQEALIIPGDIHPTLEGQQVLAKLALDVMNK